MFFRQLFDFKSSTYTYLVADWDTKEAVIIDPVLGQAVERDFKLINELNLQLVYALNTHMHADHITGTGELKRLIPGCQSVISKDSGAQADVHLVEGDEITFGNYTISAIATPGHTNGCMTFIIHTERIAFTGDTVLIRGCGRTDFQEGSAEKLYQNVHEKIFTLPDDYHLYPAHDYKGQMVTSVGEEKQFNPRLTKTLDEFVDIMNGLNLPYPKFIDQALPANKICGLYQTD